MVPWKTLATIPTSDGALQLRQRNAKEFLITIDGRVLMTSTERLSEEACARLACEPLAKRPSPRVLIGGLGMGYTLRAALDALPPGASVTVAELTPEVEQWCRGPLAVLTHDACRDRRVRIVIGDVARVIATAKPGYYDAIILDIYEGPHAATQHRDDPFYGAAALTRTHTALATHGLLSVWSEEADTQFERRFNAAGFTVTQHREGASRAHIIYLGKRHVPRAAPGEGVPKPPGQRKRPGGGARGSDRKPPRR
jgi:spermidine synthase